jgi:nuclear-control-of-ATPase protein 2
MENQLSSALDRGRSERLLDSVDQSSSRSQNEEHDPSSPKDKLNRPSNLVLAWPKLVLGPPLLLYGFRLLYTSRTSLQEVTKDAWNTLLGIWQGWLIDPLKDVLRTVRAGGEGSVIVQKEGVAADLAVSGVSCNLSLADVIFLVLFSHWSGWLCPSRRTKLYYSSASTEESLDCCPGKGDLTPILRIYEARYQNDHSDQRLPGTLLRSLFVQVQKAKVRRFLRFTGARHSRVVQVDIDQALSGIDKLLKSKN